MDMTRWDVISQTGTLMATVWSVGPPVILVGDWEVVAGIVQSGLGRARILRPQWHGLTSTG